MGGIFVEVEKMGMVVASSGPLRHCVFVPPLLLFFLYSSLRRSLSRFTAERREDRREEERRLALYWFCALLVRAYYPVPPKRGT